MITHKHLTFLQLSSNTSIMTNFKNASPDVRRRYLEEHPSEIKMITRVYKDKSKLLCVVTHGPSGIEVSALPLSQDVATSMSAWWSAATSILTPIDKAILTGVYPQFSWQSIPQAIEDYRTKLAQGEQQELLYVASVLDHHQYSVARDELRTKMAIDTRALRKILNQTESPTSTRSSNAWFWLWYALTATHAQHNNLTLSWQGGCTDTGLPSELPGTEAAWRASVTATLPKVRPHAPLLIEPGASASTQPLTPPTFPPTPTAQPLPTPASTLPDSRPQPQQSTATSRPALGASLVAGTTLAAELQEVVKIAVDIPEAKLQAAITQLYLLLAQVPQAKVCLPLLMSCKSGKELGNVLTVNAPYFGCEAVAVTQALAAWRDHLKSEKILTATDAMRQKYTLLASQVLARIPITQDEHLNWGLFGSTLALKATSSTVNKQSLIGIHDRTTAWQGILNLAITTENIEDLKLIVSELEEHASMPVMPAWASAMANVVPGTTSTTAQPATAPAATTTSSNPPPTNPEQPPKSDDLPQQPVELSGLQGLQFGHILTAMHKKFSHDAGIEPHATQQGYWFGALPKHLWSEAAGTAQRVFVQTDAEQFFTVRTHKPSGEPVCSYDEWRYQSHQPGKHTAPHLPPRPHPYSSPTNQPPLPANSPCTSHTNSSQQYGTFVPDQPTYPQPFPPTPTYTYPTAPFTQAHPEQQPSPQHTPDTQNQPGPWMAVDYGQANPWQIHPNTPSYPLSSPTPWPPQQTWTYTPTPPPPRPRLLEIDHVHTQTPPSIDDDTRSTNRPPSSRVTPYSPPDARRPRNAVLQRGPGGKKGGI